MTHHEEFNEKSQAYVSRDIFHGKSLKSFLHAFAVRKEGEDPAQARERAYQTLKSILIEADALPHPADVQAEMLKRVFPEEEGGFPEGHPVLTALHDLDESRYTTDSMAHYLDKPHKGLISAFAHLYAKEIGRPVALFEGDAMNLGGTNLELFKRLLDESYSDDIPLKADLTELVYLFETDKNAFDAALQDAPEDVRDAYAALDRDSFALADKVIATLALSTVDVIKKAVEKSGGNPDSVLPVRTGGDEVRIIAPDLPIEMQAQVLDDIRAVQAQHLTEMGLAWHRHLKKPHQHGTGIAFACADMGAQFDPKDFMNTCDDHVEEQKEKFATVLDKIEPKYKTADDISVYTSRYIGALKNSMAYATRSQDNPNVAAPANDNVPLFTSIYTRQRLQFSDKLNCDDLTNYQSVIVGRVVRSMGPMDLSTDVYTDRDLDDVVGQFKRDSDKLTGRHQGAKSYFLTIEIENLGGLNSVMTHEGADAVLKSIAGSVVKALGSRGLSVGHGSYIAHAGGGNFAVVIPPVKPNYTKNYEDWAPVTLDDIQAIENHCQQAIDHLNDRPITDFFPDFCSQNADYQQVSDISSPHKSKASIKGVGLKIRCHKIDYEPPDGAADFVAKAMEAHKSGHDVDMGVVARAVNPEYQPIPDGPS